MFNKCSFTTVATVLTVYGIETEPFSYLELHLAVATVLTVYGIETTHVHRR